MKQILITGGSSGIGLASVHKFLAKGYDVTIFDLHHPPLNHERVHFFPTDVSQYQVVEENVTTVIETIGKIDCAFLNAGIHYFGSIEAIEMEQLEQIVDINIKGVFFCLKVILPQMRKNNQGSIVLMGSDQSLVGKAESSAYGLTKGAIAQLTKSTAIDYAQFNIRVNCVCPGTIDTPLYHQAVKNYSKLSGINPESVYSSLDSAQPLGRIGQPEEVANLVYFLCSEESSFITGALLPIDGGYTCQ